MTLPSKDQENKLDNYRELKIEKQSIRQIEIYYFKQVYKANGGRLSPWRYIEVCVIFIWSLICARNILV